MEKISFEMLVSALFSLGFDKVDSVLFTYTLGKISLEDKEHQFVYEEQNTSIGFSKYVDCSGGTMRLRDGYTLDTNVSPSESVVIPVRKTLFRSKNLISFLESLDFSEIVAKKAEALGVKSVDEASTDLFCDKEISILRTLHVGEKSNNMQLGLVNKTSN